MERLQVLLELMAGQYKREAGEAAASTDKISKSAQTADKSTKTATNSMTSSMGGVASAAKGFIGIAAVGAVASFAKSSVEAASNLTESMNAVNVQFGTSAEGIHALGEESVESFGLSQRAFNEFSVQFSAFAENIAGASGRSVIDVVDEMATRIADFASVHNLTLEEATTVAQSTLAGETEAFRRFGGDVSAAAVELKGMEMGLGDTSAELSEQEKILIRYELFMDQTEKTAGDFANTSDGLANSQKSLSATFEDTQAAIGESLLPTLASAAQFLTDVLNAVIAAEEGWQNFGREIDVAREKIGFTGETVLEQIDAWEQQKEVVGETTAAMGVFNDNMTTGADVLAGYNEMAAGTNFIIENGVPILEAYNQKAREGAAAQTRAARETELTTDQLRIQFDMLADDLGTIDNYADAVQAQADAQAAVNEAVAKYGEGSPEHLAALDAEFRANRDVRDAQIAIVEQGGITRAEWVKQQVELGATQAEAELLADELDRINAFTPEPINFQVTVNGTTYGSLAAMERAIKGVGRQHGGPVFPGQQYVVGEAGPEFFIPSMPGRIVSHNESVQMAQSSTSSGGVHIENVYAMGTPASIAHDVGQQVSLELRMA